MKFRKKKKFWVKGMTLVEVILYVGISAVVLVSVAIFISLVFTSEIKNRTVAEVEQQGMMIIQLINQTIRNAAGINFPVSGVASSTLSLDVILVANDPTVFNLASGTIRIKEGAGQVVVLNNDRVMAANLLFFNLSRVGTAGNMRVQFDLNHFNPSGQNEYDYSKTFYGSASLRF